MPDITMCANGDECPKRKTCYRWWATPSDWQSFSAFYEADKECDDYWERTPHESR